MRVRHVLLAGTCCLALTALPHLPQAAPATPRVPAVGPQAARAAPSAALPAAVSRPNIVLISADDMRADDLRYMPYTRRLIARAGVTFANAVSNFPLCCPARATILTGQYPHNHGVLDNRPPNGGHPKFYRSGAENSTLPRWLAAAGYRTSFVGKYLNGYGSGRYPGAPRVGYVPPGWDDWRGGLGGLLHYYCPRVSVDGTPRSYPRRYQTDLYTAMSRQLIRDSLTEDQPFFLWVSQVAPHVGRASPDPRCSDGTNLPTPGAARHRDMFNRLPLPRSPATNEADMSDKARYLRHNRRVDLALIRKVHQGRVQSLQALDESVVEIVRELRARGALGRTVLAFTSDNGFLHGEHRLRHKVWGYEPSLRVPLLIRGPGFPAGAVRRQPVGLVDLPATAIELSDAVPTVRQDGVSLLGVARDPSYLVDRVLPTEAGPVPSIQRRVVTPVPDWFYRGVRTSRYSYLAYDMGADAPPDEELYDLDDDPFQLRGSPSRHPGSVVQRIRSASVALQDCAGQRCVVERSGLGNGGRPPPLDTSAAPTVRVLHRPPVWIRTRSALLRFRARDPDGDAMLFWCSQFAQGCNRQGEVRFRFRGEGRRYWSLFVGDSSGALTTRVGSVQVDLRRPMTRRRAPAYGVVSDSADLAWRLRDARSGVAAMDVRRRTASLTGEFGSWDRPAAWQGRTSPAVRIGAPPAGVTTCVQARAVDVAGWRSRWGATSCRAGLLDPATLADAAWTSRVGSQAVTATTGATLAVGTDQLLALVSVRAQTAPGAGRLAVQVGGTTIERIDLDAPQRRWVTFDLAVPPRLRGPVAAQVVTRGKPVVIDGIGVVRRTP